MSTVIKAANAGHVTSRLAPISLTDHVAEARRVLEESTRKAAQIEQDAKIQATKLFEHAKVEGHAAGFEIGKVDGLEAGRKEAFTQAMVQFEKDHSSAVSALDAAAGEIELLKDDLAAAAKKDLLDFAVLVARKLTFAVGEVHRESANANFVRALQLVESQSDVTVRMNPGDAATLETFAKTIKQKWATMRSVHFTPDESMAPGGCSVRSDRSEIDATLETQVDELVALLTGEACDRD